MVDFPRAYYLGYPDEMGENFEMILGWDDVDKFDEVLHQCESKRDYGGYLDMCLDYDAKDCVLHIIQGNLPLGPPDLSRDHIEPKPRRPVLYQVNLSMCEPSVFRLLLDDCQASNQANQLYNGLLPLHRLLFNFGIYPLPEMFPRRPLSQLIDLLFKPEFRTKLECAQIVAKHTQSLDQVALGYILHGEITSLAALLLVAPFTQGEFESLKRHTSMESIALQAIRSPRAAEATCYAAALLHIFQEDGHKLTSAFNEGRVVRTYKRGVEASEYDSINKIKNNRFARRQFSKSSGMKDITTMVMEMMGGDNDGTFLKRDGANGKSSLDQYIYLLCFLLKESEREANDDTAFRLSLLSAKLLDRQGELPHIIYALGTFCNDSDHVTEHFKSRHHLNLTHICLLHVLSSLGKCKYLSKWSPRQSLVKLILLLFLRRELRPTLECAKLVAKCSNSVNLVALTLIQQGELIQFAGLLLAAREKAMEPSDPGDSIVKAISLENVVSQAFYGEPVGATAGSAGLLEIFKRAGDMLTTYYWSILDHDCEVEPAEVIVEVGMILQRGGIQVVSTDVDFTHTCSDRYPEMLRSICERLGIKMDDTAAQMGTKDAPFPCIRSVKKSLDVHGGAIKLPSLDLPTSMEVIFQEGTALLGLRGDNDGFAQQVPQIS